MKSMLISYTNTLDMLPISIFYKWPNLGYTQDYQIISLNSPTLAAPVLLQRYPAYPITPMFPQKTYIQALAFILTPAFSTRSTSKNLPQPSPFLILPPATSLAIPPYQIFHHSNSSNLHSVLPPPWLQELHLPG